MAFRTQASFAWTSDYAQFYLVDQDGAAAFRAPEDIVTDTRLIRVVNGVVVYTNDCLQQVVEIRVFSAPPAADTLEWRSNRPWTEQASTVAQFPSRRFVVSSPSKVGCEAYGPAFRTDAETMIVRAQWMEFSGNRYDTEPVQPDVIRIELWPE